MAKDIKPINKVLIANRGEIAVRIARTLRQMQIASVAVYSDADAKALHVEAADEAMAIGRAPATQSYLSIENIIVAAKASGADAIHPGYGFLSENAEFAGACAKADIIFIGPGVDAMETMGNKAHAKKQMHECGVACVPGYEGEDQSDAAFVKAAKTIGYPVMVKAASGGGGRGMRLVEEAPDLLAALQQARGEAMSGFASDELILEKAITDARHIEFQVFGDSHGNIIHLGERDCSLQRRHQKVIEEAPSPALDDGLRQRMGDAAVKAAQSVSYVGAGTVEFILDQDLNFYFLEMNTRLQVEHPVTEMVTGLDLVEWQIRVARGEELPRTQDEIKINGHAIEVRLYAEDPARGFMPSTGKIERWVAPQGENIRVDAGIDCRHSVSPHYDAMLAKIIVHGETREIARLKLIDALGATLLFGPDHNKGFLIGLLKHEKFQNGTATTDLIGQELAAGRLLMPCVSIETVCIAAVLDFNYERERNREMAVARTDHFNNWSSSPLPGRSFKYQFGDESYEGMLHTISGASYRVQCADQEIDVLVTEFMGAERTIKIKGKTFVFEPGFKSRDTLFIAVDGQEYKIKDLSITDPDAGSTANNGIVTAPMHGNIVEINVKAGAKVTAETPLAVLEAMKMRHDIVAGVSGVVKTVHCTAGAQVAAGDLLFDVDEESPANATSA